MDTELKRLMSPSLALLSLATLTSDKTDFEIFIEDENVSLLNMNDAPDAVGITVNVDTSYRAYKIAQSYREKGVKVILGGIHVSANPEEASNYADSICIGEGIDIWLEFLEDLKENKIKKVYQKQSESNNYDIPIINWDLIDKNKYLYTNILTATKGCPFNCEFCYNSCKYIDNKYKLRNIEDIIKEIKMLSRDMMINASIVFGFDDDEKSVFKETADWLISQKIETMTAHILTPYPGTKLFEKLKNQNRIIDFDWRRYNTSNVVFSPKNMTEKELFEGYLWSYKYFYSFKNIIKRIPSSKKQKKPYLLFNLFYRKFGRITAFFSKIGFLNKIGKLGRKLSYNIE